jgi:hypothetical protein
MNRLPVGFLVLLAALATATGCANLPQSRSRSATVEAPLPGGPEPSVPVEEPPPARVEAPPPVRNPAVVALLQSAGQKSDDGRLDEAAATLERALRIDPKDAEIWARLADVRLRQGQNRQAEALGLKAAGLAGARRPDLLARCYGIVARARRALGDLGGARAAEEKARAAAP